MSASQDPDGLAQALSALIPTGLDNIICLNRDKANLALATESQIADLRGPITPGHVRGEFHDWYFYAINTEEKSVVKLCGYREDGYSWTTSTVRVIDFDAGLVQTTNSTYTLDMSRRGVGEPNTDHLAMICVQINSTGAGKFLGVPEFFV
jgi:hypothetical protein